MKQISVIGAGAVGQQLAKGLMEAGLNVEQVFSRKGEKASSLAHKTSAEPITELKAVNPEVDILVLALNDDVLSEIGDHFQVFHNTLLVHTSGSVRGEVLAKCGANWGVWYPLQTFSPERKLDLAKIPFCIEANSNANQDLLKWLTGQIGATYYEVGSDQREKLHLAAVMMNNFSNFLMSEASQLVNQQGLPFTMLQPLAKETLDKAFTLGPEKSQTGPAKRGNWQVIEKHLGVLEDDDLKHLYETLSKAIYNHYH